ncbi:MAG: DUF2975 domain-containing protein [Parvularculaceae bacterium]
MKAIGKRSIASILAVVLHAVRIVIWLAFMGLTVAVIVLPFLPLIVRLAAGADWVEADVDVELGDVVEVFAHFVTFGVLLYVVDRLLELLKTLRFGSPFVAENALRFRRIGNALLFGEASKVLFGLVGAATDSDYRGGIDLISIVSIAAVYVLSEVFREGARMKEDQDLTV